MSFTDQKPRVVTQEDLETKWGGRPKGERLRCYLCGYKFILGDIWRWVYHGRYINFITCKKCDGSDVRERWTKMNEEYENRFWAFHT